MCHALPVCVGSRWFGLLRVRTRPRTCEERTGSVPTLAIEIDAWGSGTNAHTQAERRAALHVARNKHAHACMAIHWHACMRCAHQACLLAAWKKKIRDFLPEICKQQCTHRGARRLSPGSEIKHAARIATRNKNTYTHTEENHRCIAPLLDNTEHRRQDDILSNICRTRNTLQKRRPRESNQGLVLQKPLCFPLRRAAPSIMVPRPGCHIVWRRACLFGTENTPHVPDVFSSSCKYEWLRGVNRTQRELPLM